MGERKPPGRSLFFTSTAALQSIRHCITHVVGVRAGDRAEYFLPTRSTFSIEGLRIDDPFCAEKLREEEGRAWLIWAMRSGRRIRNDRAMEQQEACYGRIEGRRRAKE